MRIGKKSVYQGNTSETSYVVSGTQILSETKGSSTNYYIYDDKGLPIGIVYNGTTYTYRKNLQGDIIAILDSAGNEVVTYIYHAWGNVTVGGSLASTLGTKNPFRYRGYYYDTETGYYYLNSRYYDPITGRFLNPEPNVDISGFDSGAGLLGYNVYAYCKNNPVMYLDYTGEAVVSSFALFGLAVIGNCAIAATTHFISTPEFQRSWQETCAFIADATKDVDIVGIKISTSIKSVIKKLSELKQREYKSDNEKHHIVAQNAKNGKLAYGILVSVGIDPVTDPRNIIL